MVKFWKKEETDLLFSTPRETMGFTKDKSEFAASSFSQTYTIKRYDFSSVKQVEDIKNQLLAKKILILNAHDLLENEGIPINELKNAVEDIKAFLNENGGSIGRIGDQFLVLTPNTHVKILG